MIALVLAMARNGVIGKDGALPWRIPEDMRRFKAVTLGKPCIMGRKTWDSLPKKPLPGRTNIVVTRERNWHADGAQAFNSLDDAIAFAQAETAGEICVIGGAEIYKLALPLAHIIHLTEVGSDFDGDTRLQLDRSAWRETSREDRQTPEGLTYSYVTLERTVPPG